MEVTLAARKEKASASLHPGIEEIRQWMEQADPEPEHEQQVTRLALALFDQLGPLHRLDGRARILLQAA
ncbi:hypothetical protein FJY63_14015, partial [Candidatus Sumerlaeota bacterium]|nr:hypothetical protein [Candidatus Sumerlaeota bacterium]